MDSSNSQPRYYTRAFGRKRVVSDSLDVLALSGRSSCTNKRHCQSTPSLLQSMPQDILIRILCGVDHSDLGRLISVSKAIKEAALIAKDSYFAFRTPKRETESENGGDLDSPIAPNAPKINRKHKSWFDIAVVLFPEEEVEEEASQQGRS